MSDDRVEALWILIVFTLLSIGIFMQVAAYPIHELGWFKPHDEAWARAIDWVKATHKPGAHW